MEVAFLFRSLLCTLECILTRQHISSLCCTMFLALRRIVSIHPFLSNSSTEKLVVSMITSRLDYCNATFTGVADEQIVCIRKIQNNATRLILKKTHEAWSCHTAFERTPLAPSKKTHSVQACNAHLLSLQRHSSTIPVFFSLHMSTIALLSFFERKTAQNSPNKLENLWWMLFWLHCSDCLELAAGRPKILSLSPSFQS